MSNDNDCRNCRHLGADPDSNYCGHPEAFKISMFGMNPSWARGVGRYAAVDPALTGDDRAKAEATFGEKAICYQGKLFTPRTPEEQREIDEMAERVLRRAKKPTTDEQAVEIRHQAKFFNSSIPMSLREMMKTSRSRRFETIPPIVCLCGSTRFHDEFQKANYELTMQGKIVLSVGFFVHGLSDGELCERLIKAAETCNVVNGEWQSKGFWRTMLAIMRGAHSEDVGCTPIQKHALDDLHLRKIDLSDEVHVLNKGGYIGSSTQRELAYAIMLDRKVTFLEPEEGTRYLANDKYQHELGAHIAKLMEQR